MNKNKCKICGQHQWSSTNQPQWLVGLSLTPCSEADYVTDLLCSPATNCRLPSQIFITIDPAGPGCRLLFCYSRLWPQLSYEFLSDRLGARGGLLWPRYHAGLIRISGAARCPLRLMDHVVLIQSRGGGGMERRGSELVAEGRSDEERKIKKKKSRTAEICSCASNLSCFVPLSLNLAEDGSVSSPPLCLCCTTCPSPVRPLCQPNPSSVTYPVTNRFKSDIVWLYSGLFLTFVRVWTEVPVFYNSNSHNWEHPRQRCFTMTTWGLAVATGQDLRNVH